MIKTLRKSLAAKVFLCIFVLLLVCCMLIYTSVLIVMPATYKTELSNQFMADLHNLLNDMETMRSQEASERINDFCISNNAEITISDADGNALAAYPQNYYAKLVGTGGSKGGEVTRVNATGSVVFSGSQQEYTVLASANLKPVNETAGILLRLLPLVVLMIIAISFFGAFLFSRYLSRPIIKISRISKRMASLDMTWRCDASRIDEIGQLSENLNDMAVNLDNTMKDLQTANIALKHDIERERAQERQRRDFFAAVSHELKTPITILKGQLEGMIGNVGMYQDREKFLRHALNKTESMGNLVKEILAISKIEAQVSALKLSKANISEMLAACCQEYEALISEKGMRLRLNIEEGLYSNIDVRLFKKAISNIIGNAIGHSPNGSIVQVNFNENGLQGVLTVENSGVYIDENDTVRLFEPFYRADKSRSRNTGGSGLGLYIVKTILDMHHADYKIENSGSGVIFTAAFDLASP